MHACMHTYKQQSYCEHACMDGDVAARHWSEVRMVAVPGGSQEEGAQECVSRKQVAGRA